MIINSLNMDMLMPDDQIEYEKQKEEERREKLKSAMEEIICEKFSNKDLCEIQRYKKEIFDYLVRNGNLDLTDNTSKLEIFIKICYRILSKKDVSLNEYVLLQSLSRTSKNEVAEKIQRQYKEAKDIVISVATEKCIEQGETTLDDDSINKAIDELIEQYKTGNLDEIGFGAIYEKYKDESNRVKALICKSLGFASFEELEGNNSLTNAISTIIYLESNTDLGLDSHLRDTKLQLQKVK